MSNESPIEGVGFNEFVEAVTRLSRDPGAVQEVAASLGLAGPERWLAVERAWRDRIDADPMLRQVYEMFVEQAGVGSAPNTTSSTAEPANEMLTPSPAARPAQLFVPSYLRNAPAPAPLISPAPAPAAPEPAHPVAVGRPVEVALKGTLPASAFTPPVSLPFTNKPQGGASRIVINDVPPTPAEQSGFTTAPNSKALNAAALPFPSKAADGASDADEMPLERYAEITSLLLREGNPDMTFARMGVDAAGWMKIVQRFSVRFEQDPSLKARFDALVGAAPAPFPTHPPSPVPQNKPPFAGTLPPTSDQPPAFKLPFSQSGMSSSGERANDRPNRPEVLETMMLDPARGAPDAARGLPPFALRVTPTGATKATPPATPPPAPLPTQEPMLPPLGRFVQIQAALASAPDRARALAEAGYTAEAWQTILRRYGEMMQRDPALRSRYEALLEQVRGGG